VQVGQQVYPDDWDLEIGYHETPGAVPPKSDIQRKGRPPVGWYRRTVSCEQVLTGSFLGSRKELPGEDAEVKTGVDQEPQFTGTIRDEKAAGW
jgi:hypothetical protein